MRNQYMAQVLVHNKVVSEDQVKAHWGEITESMDIGQVLVKAGILQQAMYAKVLAFVQNLEAKHAAANAAAQPAQVQPATPKPAPAAAPAPKPAPVEAKPAVAEPVDDEPALQIEGNNIYGESSSSNMVVEKVSGLETTSISTISIAEETGEDSAEDGEQELPRQFALSSGEGTAVEAPQTLLPIMSLKKMIAFARQYGATDIYLYSNRQVVMRQSGALFPATEQVVDKTRISELLAEASEGFADGYQVVAGKNFSRTIALAGVGRARISVTWNGVVPSVSIRVIPTEAAALDSLNLPPFCTQFAELNSGLVLVAGPSASGRTTTVNAFAETIAANRPCYIQTIERPIERILQTGGGALVQKEVGLHVRTGLDGIALAMRDGADVICFDHLENVDELNLLLQAANSGALVFAVTRGNNIHALLSRLLVSVPESGRSSLASSLADQLKGVIVQHLVPVVDNQGLVLAAEAVRVTPTIAGMIRKGDLSQLNAAISSQRDQGVTLDDSLQKCVEAGYIDGVEAWKRANDIRRFAAYHPAGGEA
ncbi:type IV pilus twitching motility protein PilT [Fibrobacter sp.]|uniref:type IV pilus twitching motility protein PilT n=1 Tax=Fibrobacter sp. TaxID=35828 RepID=UPI00388E7A5E